MKKTVRKMLFLALACMMLVSISLTANAAEFDPARDSMLIKLENGPEAGYVTSTGGDGTLFTLSAKNVTSFLSTQAHGKCFVPSDYMTLGSTVWADGNFIHSNGKDMKAGVCYYSPSVGKYLPAGSAAGFIKSNTDFSFHEDMRNLLQGTTYYGYVSNYSNSGSVIDGSMTVSVAVG